MGTAWGHELQNEEAWVSRSLCLRKLGTSYLAHLEKPSISHVQSGAGYTYLRRLF